LQRWCGDCLGGQSRSCIASFSALVSYGKFRAKFSPRPGFTRILAATDNGGPEVREWAVLLRKAV